MAYVHQHRRLIASATLGCLAALLPSSELRAAENPAQTMRASQRPLQGALGADRSPEVQSVRRAIESLSPEQRRRFGENMMRWSNLSAEEKKALRETETVRQKYIEQEVNLAIASSGLRLEGQRRAEFVKRYTEERRIIEEQLRAEVNEKRKPLVRELVDRLKMEFADPKR